MRSNCCGLATERASAEARELELQAESAAVRARLAELEVELRDGARRRWTLPATVAAKLAAHLAKLESDEQYMAETRDERLGATAEVAARG